MIYHGEKKQCHNLFAGSDWPHQNEMNKVISLAKLCIPYGLSSCDAPEIWWFLYPQTIWASLLMKLYSLRISTFKAKNMNVITSRSNNLTFAVHGRQGLPQVWSVSPELLVGVERNLGPRIQVNEQNNSMHYYSFWPFTYLLLSKYHLFFSSKWFNLTRWWFQPLLK